MVDSRFILKVWAAAAVFAASEVLCSAQNTPAANSSLFSAPTGGGMTGPASAPDIPIVGAGDSGVRGANSFAAPSLPEPTPDYSPAQRKRMNDQSEWTLLTPEEIMGLQTPEEIFGIPESDPAQNASAEERYLMRMDKAKANPLPAENGVDLSNPEHDYTGLFERPDDRDPLGGEQDKSDSSSFSHIFGKSEASPFVKTTGAFALPQQGVFISAADKMKAEQEQAAEMQRFRELIGEVPQQQTADLPTPHLNLNADSQPESPFDEAGHQILSHPTDPSKPDGLDLPTDVVGYAAPPRKVKRPSWEAQPPPWISDQVAPPSAPPLRKFY